MRKTAAVTVVAALGVAVALVLRFRPDTEPSAPPDSASPPHTEVDASAVEVRDERGAATDGRPSSFAPQNADARAAPPEARAPLPGETPATPMTQFLNDLKSNAIVARTTPIALTIPPEIIERERAFAVEPIDAAWAPGAEADLLAQFAQQSGLKLTDLRVECRSTMCRIELSQPVAPGERPVFDSLLEPIGPKPWFVITMIDPSGAGLKSFAYRWRDGFAPPAPSGEAHDAK